MGFKYNTRRVRSLSCLVPGDHIRVFHGLYYHHMLVVKVHSDCLLTVIHYTGPEKVQDIKQPGQAANLASSASSLALSSGSEPIAIVSEERVLLDPAEETIEVLEYADDGVVKHTGYKAISRARTRIGETTYSVFHNNCESLVNWAITGQSESNQGEIGKAVAIVGAVGVGIGMLAILAAMALNSDDDDDKKKK